MSIIESINASVIEAEKAEVEKAVQQALAEGIPAKQILNEGLIKAMDEVGRRFEEGDFYVPEMLIAARAMQAGLAQLKSHLIQDGIKAKGVVVLGTVKGDLHDIGKNLVGMMLEGAGYEVTDLGTDVVAEKFVEAVKEKDANILAMSALLTTTMNSMRGVIKALEAADLHHKVKVMVGGAPVTESYAKEIGADGYAPDASRAVSLANSLTNH